MALSNWPSKSSLSKNNFTSINPFPPRSENASGHAFHHHHLVWCHALKPAASSKAYSPNLVEGVFYEVRIRHYAWPRSYTDRNHTFRGDGLERVEPDEHLSDQDPSGHRRLQRGPVGRPDCSGTSSENPLRSAHHPRL